LRAVALGQQPAGAIEEVIVEGANLESTHVSSPKKRAEARDASTR